MISRSDANRLDRVIQISRVNPDVVKVLDYFDDRKGRWEPHCYEVLLGDVTVWLGIVFGDILFYKANKHVWQVGMNKKPPIPDECRDKVDALIDRLWDETCRNQLND